MPIVIAGMHRSGTSMVTRLLNLCGLYLGDEKDLVPKEEDNPEGFWENAKFQLINDEILALFDGAWDAPPAFERNWEFSPYLTSATKNAQQAIKEISSTSPWGWKDPRNSLTLPFWQKQIPDLKVVFCLRNPFDVYRSLARRGYSSGLFAYQLWLKYNQQLVVSSTSSQRIITHYDSFFYDPQAELRRLVDFLGLETSDEQISTACKTISTNLRHNRSDNTSLLANHAPEQVLNLYHELCLRAGDVYRSSISPSEWDRIQHFIPIDDSVAWDEVQRLTRYLEIVTKENALLEQEVLEIKQEKDAEIARIYGEKSAEVAQAYAEKATEVTRAYEEKAMEIAQVQENYAVEINRFQEERNILQGTIHEILTSRSWRFIKIFQNIRLFFIPRGSRRENAVQTVYYLLNFTYVKRLLAVLRGDVIVNSSAPVAIDPIHAVSTQIYTDLVGTAKGRRDHDEYVPVAANTDFSASESLVKLIAFYLPQFHPIPENDEWWGKGFVEWTNVSKAVPQFVGHYQPHLPGELGFYDLRVPDVQKRQIELARQYGIYGFAFHYYWFNGKRLLEKPLDMFLHSKENFPFCICWANENWTRRWDGQENELLIAQNHSPESDLSFIQDISPILKDERYIRIDGRPLLIVYRANIIPDIKNTVKLWREYCVNNGIGNPYLVAAQTFWFEDPREVDFDAAVEFPPHNVSMTNIRSAVQISNPNYQGNVYTYSEIVTKKTSIPQTDYKVFKTIFPGWDNEARKPERGNSFAFSTPARYKDWLIKTAEITMRDPDPDKRLVFINAWNEWGEGAHLEPDRKYGYAYLQATLDALKEINHKN